MTPIQKRAERVRSIPLKSVLRLWQAQPDPHDRHKWHTAEGVISVTGSKFMNWTRGVGGGGAIDLVLHLQHRGFMAALEWLECHFPGAWPLVHDQVIPKALALPSPEPDKLGQVQDYLILTRGLPAPIIVELVHASRIYADARANAVFLHLGERGHPVGAELRGTHGEQWRAMAPGSRKDMGYFAVGPEQAGCWVLCESAIDALSCWALHPEYRCLSTAGARPDPHWLGPLLQKGLQLCCAFDADPTGDAMAQAMITRYPAITRLRPSAKDWNDLLKIHLIH